MYLHMAIQTNQQATYSSPALPSLQNPSSEHQLHSLIKQPQHDGLAGEKGTKAEHDGVGGGLDETVHDTQADIGPGELCLEIKGAVGRGEKFAGRRRLGDCQGDADHVETGW